MVSPTRTAHGHAWDFAISSSPSAKSPSLPHFGRRRLPPPSPGGFNAIIALPIATGVPPPVPSHLQPATSIGAPGSGLFDDDRDAELQQSVPYYSLVVNRHREQDAHHATVTTLTVTAAKRGSQLSSPPRLRVRAVNWTATTWDRSSPRRRRKQHPASTFKSWLDGYERPYGLRLQTVTIPRPPPPRRR